jgi:hypothetical protein
MRPLLLGTAFVLSAVGALVTARPAAGQADLSTDALGVRIDQRGQVVSLLDRQHGREYLPSGQAAPLLSIKTAAGGIDPPSVLAYDPKTGIVTLTYAARGVRARVKATRKPTHLVLEIVGIEPANTVDAVVWGPSRGSTTRKGSRRGRSPRPPRFPASPEGPTRSCSIARFPASRSRASK